MWPSTLIAHTKTPPRHSCPIHPDPLQTLLGARTKKNKQIKEIFNDINQNVRKLREEWAKVSAQAFAKTLTLSGAPDIVRYPASRGFFLESPSTCAKSFAKY